MTKPKYSSWLHAGFYSGLQKLSVPLSAVFITMILTKKVLVKEQVGVWALFMTITSIIELFRQGLVKTAMVRYINQAEKEEQPNVIGAGLYLNAIITIIVSLILLSITSWLANLLEAPDLKNMLYFFQLALIINIPFSHFEWLMYSKQVFKGLYWTYVVRQGSTLLLAFLMLYIKTDMPLIVLVFIYTFSMLLATFVAYQFVKKYLVKIFVFSREWIFKLFHFGKYVFASSLSTIVFRNADQMMLTSILNSTSITGLQSIALRFITLADLPSQTLGDLLFPRSSQVKSAENPSLLKYYYEKTVGAALCVVMPLILMVFVFPKFIIYILATPEYYEVIPYLRIIMLTSITLAFLKQFGVIMDSTGKQVYNLATITFLAVLQIILCYFFISSYGLMGAGYALLISHIIGFIVSQSLLKYFYKVNFLNSFKYAFQFYSEFYNILKQKLK